MDRGFPPITLSGKLLSEALVRTGCSNWLSGLEKASKTKLSGWLFCEPNRCRSIGHWNSYEYDLSARVNSCEISIEMLTCARSLCGTSTTISDVQPGYSLDDIHLGTWSNKAYFRYREVWAKMCGLGIYDGINHATSNSFWGNRWNGEPFVQVMSLKWSWQCI